MRQWIFSLCLLSGVLAVAQPVQDSVAPLPVIQIADSALAALQTRSDVVRISRDSLGQFAASGNGLEGVLRQVPGVQVLAYGGHGGLSAVALRGFSANMTAFTIDGLPYQTMQTGIVNFGAFLPDAFDELAVQSQPISPDVNPLGGTVAAKGVAAQNFRRIKAGLGSFGEQIYHASSGFGVGEGYSRFMTAYQHTQAVDNYPFDYVGVQSRRANSRFSTDQLWLSQSHQLGKKRDISLRIGALAVRTRQDVPAPVTSGSQPGEAGDSLLMQDIFSYLSIEKALTKNQLHTLSIKTSAHYNNLIFYGKANTDFRPFDQYRNTDWLIQAGSSHVWRRHVLQTSLQTSGAWLNGNNLAISFVPITFVRRLQANAGLSHVWYVRPLQERNAFRVTSVLRLNLPEGYGLRPNWAMTLTSLPQGDTGRWEIFAHLHYGYRIPSFNELYYFGYGNAKLKPELARSMDYGVYYRLALRKPQLQAALRMTIFYNNVLNKIISVPISPAAWSTYAIGETQAAGAEWVAEITLPKWQIHYSYILQQAIDVTRQERPLLPYTPRESLTYGLRYEGRRWHGWLNGAYSGWRFATRANTQQAFLPAFHTLDLGLGRTWRLAGWQFRLDGQMANVLNTQYAVIQGYPMPGRSLRGLLIIQF